MTSASRRMLARDPSEPHRVASSLELLYDLCFVVAIAQAAAALHHEIGHGHAAHGALAFGVTFCAIWWAWMGFAWFASAFETDDAVYRLKVLVQMCGVLVFAAGVRPMFQGTDFTLGTLGYAIMRIGLVGQWLRAARSVPAMRRTATRYATGIVLLQLCWIGALWLPTDRWLLAFFTLIPFELLVPAWAERAGRTPWHPHHIAERYGLLTIIVLGESVLAATLAVQSAAELGAAWPSLLPVIVAGPVILFSMWWIYFSRPHHELLCTLRAAFVWGYGHYVIFAAAAAVGAGLAVAVDEASGAGGGHHAMAGPALALPIGAFLAAYWFLVLRPCPNGRRRGLAFGLALLALIATPWLPQPPLWIAGVLALLTVAVHTARTSTTST